MAWRFTLFLTATVWLAIASPGAAQQDALQQAKALYGSAAYAEALAMLERLQEGSAEEVGIEVALYRMFCLVVLDRGEEAAEVIEDIVMADPFFLPASDQASPRIRAIFEEQRRSILPSVARQLYANSRDAFTNRRPGAAEGFDRVVRLLDDPDLAADASLADLRILAREFRDLTTAAAELAASAAPAEPPVGTESDVDVLQPVAVSQTMPPWSPQRGDARRAFTGEVEVLIDEQGNVVSAKVRQPIHRDYDEDIVRQAKSWKYRPATRDGVPIRFLKVLRIELRPPQD